MTRLTMLVLALATIGVAATADAQPGCPTDEPSGASTADDLDTPIPEDEALERAQETFAAGNEAWAEGRWEDAFDAYESAYDLAPRPLILVNLAGAELRTGRLVDAARHYREFLRRADGEAEQRFREAAERALGELETRIPRARLDVRNLDAGDRLLLDCDTLSRAVSGTEVAVDPGRHELSAERDGEIIAMTRFEAAESETVEVTLVVPPRPEPEPEVVYTESSSIFESPWFWTGVGAAVAAAVVVVVVAVSQSATQPFVGNLGAVEL